MKIELTPYDYLVFRDYCLKNPEDIHIQGAESIRCKNGYDYIYKDNHTNILGVAHRDTVLGDSGGRYFIPTTSGNVITPQLDDRVGIFTLLHFLPKYGINFDILLTDGEESGQSTAMFFTANKQYNWIFEFDRRGEDVVFYNFQSDEMVSLLGSYGFTVGKGSISDISYLEDLGAKAFNIGCGYHGEHTHDCYFLVSEYLRQVRKFINFYEDNRDTHFKHTIKPVYKPVKQKSHQTLLNSGNREEQIIAILDKKSTCSCGKENCTEFICRECGEIVHQNGYKNVDLFVTICDACMRMRNKNRLANAPTKSLLETVLALSNEEGYDDLEECRCDNCLMTVFGTGNEVSVHGIDVILCENCYSDFVQQGIIDETNLDGTCVYCNTTYNLSDNDYLCPNCNRLGYR